jgi:hypothetical protein
MKKYEINFDAITTKDEVVGNLTLPINLPDNRCIERKPQALQRLCVEYARLNNIACSFANIISIKEEN